MTETTSIQGFRREGHTYAPDVRRPGLATFIGQAAAGSFIGSFIMVTAHILFVYQPYNSLFVFYLPFQIAMGLLTGTVAGFLIWAATREADGQLLGIVRSLIGTFVMTLTWFAVWYSLIGEEGVTPDTHLWMLTGIVVSGVSIGLVTGSRLRLWRELVRGGETRAPLLRVLAGFIGFVLRSVIGFSFLASLLIVITEIQSYYHESSTELPLFWVSYLALFSHLLTGTVILFARMKFSTLVVRTVISIAPLVLTFWVSQMGVPERNFLIGYIGVWALFLLTRWRQMDVAFATLKEELRYYLID